MATRTALYSLLHERCIAGLVVESFEEEAASLIQAIS